MTTDWRNRAACRREDPEVFFPLGSGPASDFDRATAKRICLGCPVRTECLEFALAHGLGHGIFGGLDEHERRNLKHRAPAT